MDFIKEMNDRTAYVNNVIDMYLPKESGYQKVVFEAMNYSVHAGGKRIRPIFMMEVAKLFGGNVEDVIKIRKCAEAVS